MVRRKVDYVDIMYIRVNAMSRDAMYMCHVHCSGAYSRRCSTFANALGEKTAGRGGRGVTETDQGSKISDGHPGLR